MRTNVKKFSIFTIVFTALIICCMAFPSSAFALTSEDIGALAGGKHYYYNGSAEDQWVLTNNKWEHCDIVDSSENLDKVVSALRREMIKKNENVTFYIALSYDAYNEKLNPDSEDYKTQAEKLTDENINEIYNKIKSNIYKTDSITDNLEKAKSGDYLRKTVQTLSSTTNSGRISASDTEGAKYSYYKLDFEIEYTTTAAMENKVDEFLAKWQTEFIDNNSVIQNPDLTENERNYYIVKTIYSF
ncbi:MAG: hypothetical protein PUE08_08345, partial [Eubacteriales bacterium]|nr:hypothetical protein [Eubacteriales bacterium]